LDTFCGITKKRNRFFHPPLHAAVNGELSHLTTESDFPSGNARPLPAIYGPAKRHAGMQNLVQRPKSNIL
jgi:hypothetical protein